MEMPYRNSHRPDNSDDENANYGYEGLQYPVHGSTNSNPSEYETDRSHHRTTKPDARKKQAKGDNVKRVKPQFGLLETGAPFAHIGLDSDLDSVKKLLLDRWKLRDNRPKMIISIIGGAKGFKLSDQLESAVVKGIIDVAFKSNGWVITNGNKVGVIKLIGETIEKLHFKQSKKKIIAIGISKWGCVKNVETITDKRNHHSNMNSNINQPKIFKNDDDKDKLQKGECFLEMNHSHYLLVDDGTHRDFSTGDFRTRLCRKLADNNSGRIPVVTIVVEGGLDTLTNIYYDLKDNISIVLVDGSGRIADFLSHWLSITKDVERNSPEATAEYGIHEFGEVVIQKPGTHKTIPEKGRVLVHVDLHADSAERKLLQIFKNYIDAMKKDLAEMFRSDNASKKKQPADHNAKNDDHHKDSKLQTALYEVMYCLQPSVRSRISVFTINSTSNLSETIFERICLSEAKQNKNKTHQSQDPDVTSLIKLAMDFDCIDVAKELVFENSLSKIDDQQQPQLFIDALRNNRPAFVSEFLRLGLDPVRVFFHQIPFEDNHRYDYFISTMYRNVETADFTHLKYFVKVVGQESTSGIHNTDALNTALRNLVGDYMHIIYTNSTKEESQYKTSWGLSHGVKKLSRANYEDLESHSNAPHESKEKAHKYIMRDLFLWAILMNRIDMAKIFLFYLKHRICAALIATKILKQYYKQAAYGESKDKYKENYEFFEQYAINCLDECNERNASDACQLVVQQNDLYGYVTCLQVASSADDKKFIAQPACVEVMNSIWYDKLYPKQTGLGNLIRLFIGIITLGFLAPLFVPYQDKNEIIHRSYTSHRMLAKNGITYCDSYYLTRPEYITFALSVNEYIIRFFNFHRSLVVKFIYRVMSYIFFLLLFSYVLLFQFSPPTNSTPSIDWTEVLTIIFVSCMLIEELYYFCTLDNLTFLGKVQYYMLDPLRVLTIVGFILFYIGLIVRFTSGSSEDNFVAARIVMAIDIEVWWLRCLSFIIVFPFLGPHLVAIAKMLRDLGFFLIIIAIVMLAYGVASRSMVYYPIANGFSTLSGGTIDTSFSGRPVFRNILYPVFYLLYGQVDGQRQDLDNNADAGWAITTQVLLAFQMIFVNILLLNLLIAMFSKRFEQVYEDTRDIWHSQQYLFTREYFARTPFIPPLTVFYDLFCLAQMLFYLIRRAGFDGAANDSTITFKMIPETRELAEKWRDFEGSSSYKYAQNEAAELKNETNKLIEHLGTNIEEDTKSTMDEDEKNSKIAEQVKDLQVELSKLNSMLDSCLEEYNKKPKDF